MDPLHEQALMIRSRQGDADALGEIYDAYAPRLYTFIYYKVHHRETAQDLLSITFTKALAALPRYQPSKGPAAAWLYTIARNTIIDHYRRLRPQENLEDAWDLSLAATQERDADLAGKIALVHKHLTQLTPLEREILTMRVWQEMSYAEIAAALGKREDACKVAFYRAVRRLRSAMPVAAFLAFVFFRQIP